jgi:hypothetical protein
LAHSDDVVEITRLTRDEADDFPSRGRPPLAAFIGGTLAGA